MGGGGKESMWREREEACKGDEGRVRREEHRDGVEDKVGGVEAWRQG